MMDRGDGLGFRRLIDGMRAMMGVAGVGPKLAERIMAYRVAYGPFRSRTALQGSVATYGAVS
jgi:hypothetical protein